MSHTPSLHSNQKGFIGSIVYMFFGLLIGALVIRLLLVLLGANPANQFANFIFNSTQPFVTPFFGLFNYQSTLGVSSFEFATVVAIVVYGIIAGVLGSILGRRTYRA